MFKSELLTRWMNEISFNTPPITCALNFDQLNNSGGLVNYTTLKYIDWTYNQCFFKKNNWRILIEKYYYISRKKEREKSRLNNVFSLFFFFTFEEWPFIDHSMKKLKDFIDPLMIYPNFAGGGVVR